MKTRDKVTAIAELEALIAETDRLKGLRRFSAPHTEWLMRTLSFLEEVFGRDSKYYKVLKGYPWENTGSMLVGGLLDPFGPDIRASIEHQHQEAYQQQIDSARGVLSGALAQLKAVDDLAGVYEGKDTPQETSLILRVIASAEHKLRKAIREVPQAEREIQDAFETLLIGADIPYSRETDHIEYSSKTYIPDFVLGRIDLAIDTKLCAKKGREKEIIAEINDDILAYKTKYSNLLFIVYDLGFIRDTDLFISSFQDTEGVVVIVVKH